MLLVGTGHLGASLTHGKRLPHRTINRNDQARRPTGQPYFAGLKQNPILLRVIKPIFEKRCTSCHGEGSKKENFAWINLKYILKEGVGPCD